MWVFVMIGKEMKMKNNYRDIDVERVCCYCVHIKTYEDGWFCSLDSKEHDYYDCRVNMDVGTCDDWKGNKDENSNNDANGKTDTNT